MLSKPPNRLQRAAARFNAVLHAQRGSDGAPWQRFRILRDLFIRSGAGNARLSALGLVALPCWRKTHFLPRPGGFGAATATVTLNVPQLPAYPVLEFAEHVTGEDGRATGPSASDTEWPVAA